MKASIIITSYNYGRYLERCLRSCLNQNFPKDQYEIIVIDDRSTDNTQKIMGKFKDKNNVRYIRNKKNLGVAGSANVGIVASLGQFIVRVDADDYVSRNLLLFLTTYLEYNPQAFCVSCDYIYVNNEGEKFERVFVEEKPISCGIMYRKDVLVNSGMYNKAWRHREEEELRKRLGSHYKIHHLRIPLYRYRMHESNKTKQLDMMEKFQKRLEDVETLHKPVINLDPAEDKRPLTEYVVAVIPARGGSKRLKRKNIHPIWGKPMLHWVIQAAKKSKYINDVFVSTEDVQIKKEAERSGAKVIDRPYKLAADKVFKQDVICHATRVITEKFKKPTLVISLQANSPEVKPAHIDKGIKHLIKYNKNEVMSVDKKLNQNAAIRIMTYNTVFQQSLSGHFGVFIADILDVHTKNDLKKIEKRKRKI